MANYNAENIVLFKWFHNRAPNEGYPSWDIISALATLRTAERLGRVVQLLESINGSLASLGRDGIHEVIRAAAHTARAKTARRRRQKRLSKARMSASRGTKKTHQPRRKS